MAKSVKFKLETVTLTVVFKNERGIIGTSTYPWCTMSETFECAKGFIESNLEAENCKVLKVFKGEKSTEMYSIPIDRLVFYLTQSTCRLDDFVVND